MAAFLKSSIAFSHSYGAKSIRIVQLALDFFPLQEARMMSFAFTYFLKENQGQFNFEEVHPFSPWLTPRVTGPHPCILCVFT